MKRLLTDETQPAGHSAVANLFGCLHIPALFVRADGHLTNFTPAVTEVVHVSEADIGRPIADIVARFDFGDLIDRLTEVFLTLNPYEVQVHQTQSDTWWIARLQPYGTLPTGSDGVMISFADITNLKQAEAERERLLAIVQQAHDELELRAQERTSELAAANAALQAEIAERTIAERTRQQLLHQLVTAQEEERRHIARELHDQLGQDLTGLILGLKALRDSIAADSTTSDRVRHLQEQAMQLGREVRTLAVQLRPSALDDLGLLTTLENYVERWSARALVAVDFQHIGLDTIRLPIAVETTLYRLVQEALTNVLKHAQATNVSIIIERRVAEVSLIVEDDGVGFDMAVEHRNEDVERGLGLIGMRERVGHLDGTIVIEAEPDSGTTVFIRLPLTASL